LTAHVIYTLTKDNALPIDQFPQQPQQAELPNGGSEAEAIFRFATDVAGRGEGSGLHIQL
jgi:hypothetical protein